MVPTVAFWSGGKDSALALDRIQRAGTHDVVALITTVNAHYGRVSMHGVREDLIDRQTDAIGVPLHKMYVGGRGSNDDYVPALRGALAVFKERGVAHVAFGDIFLEDLRVWREDLLTSMGLTGVFPLWKENTHKLAQEFIARRFKAVTCCVNDAHLREEDVGRALDAQFFRSLPKNVDPCGENGEYHSFVHDGPIFRHPVDFQIGEVVYRPLEPSGGSHHSSASGPAIPVPSTTTPTATKGFWFVDLLSASTQARAAG